MAVHVTVVATVQTFKEAESSILQFTAMSRQQKG